MIYLLLLNPSSVYSEYFVYIHYYIVNKMSYETALCDMYNVTKLTYSHCVQQNDPRQYHVSNNNIRTVQYCTTIPTPFMYNGKQNTNASAYAEGYR